jgi:hypothetical protein
MHDHIGSSSDMYMKCTGYADAHNSSFNDTSQCGYVWQHTWKGTHQISSEDLVLNRYIIFPNLLQFLFLFLSKSTTFLCYFLGVYIICINHDKRKCFTNE